MWFFILGCYTKTMRQNFSLFKIISKKVFMIFLFLPMFFLNFSTSQAVPSALKNLLDSVINFSGPTDSDQSSSIKNKNCEEMKGEKNERKEDGCKESGLPKLLGPTQPQQSISRDTNKSRNANGFDWSSLFGGGGSESGSSKNSDNVPILV